ncbi:MAG: V-type ATP synthase subunit I [Actinomycetota bacterium]
MSWRESLAPARMNRVAICAPTWSLRDVLVAVADEGCFEPQLSREMEGPASVALHRMQDEHPSTDVEPALAAHAVNLEELEADARVDLVAGEAALERVTSGSVAHRDVSALVGWTPSRDRERLARRIAPLGGALVTLPMPRGVDPPTAMGARGAVSSFRPLVETYAVVPYRNIDPTTFAALSYVLMFGIMFADVGHGLLLAAAGVFLRFTHNKTLSRVRRAWTFLVAAGAAATVFGFVFGEAFGPTGLVPVLWIAPLDDPVRLLGAAIVVGAGLLGVSYVIGTINRWREGGWHLALYSSTGLAGSFVFVGVGLLAAGLLWGQRWLIVAGGLWAAIGVVLTSVGLFAATEGGGTGVMEAAVELFDALIRLGSNVVSFARLAAFGLTHAALGSVVWDGTVGLWHHGPGGIVFAAVLFVVGNAITFSLEALVAGVQALRLEYYELFSRIFASEGRPFRPWQARLVTKEGPR